MGGSFKADNAGIQAIALGPEMRAMLAEVAEAGKAAAEAMSQDFRITGDYAASFQISEGTSTIGRNKRAEAILENTSDHAVAVEWGNARDHRPHHVLGRTIDQLRAP